MPFDSAVRITVEAYKCIVCGQITESIDELDWHSRLHDRFYDQERLWSKELIWRHPSRRKVRKEQYEFYLNSDQKEILIPESILHYLVKPSSWEKYSLAALCGDLYSPHICLLYLVDLSGDRLAGALVYDSLPTYPWLDTYYRRVALLVDPFFTQDYRCFIRGMLLRQEAYSEQDCY